ncbi:U4/U6-U5 snRNP complex subunit prp31 [Rhizophlyctis rosea]|uniref:U4/U6-U5 snRNP complex subunit prp31 n=1 Tax=Rhizophlyctis rosea TaxID=64517 RepID=A0AAD5X764_9FUNG|nr:U4/U6-U5 snRNP complex subunit prp31 [Rhizophlyctis rosea]
MDEDLLQDLEDLGEDEDNVDVKEEDLDDDEDDKDVIDMDGVDDEGDDDEEQQAADAILAASIKSADNIRAIARLSGSRLFRDVLQKIETFKSIEREPAQNTGPVEDDPEYALIVQANNLVVDIDNEILTVHKFLRDHYAPKFPELESLLQNPLDYAKTVKFIGNEMDLTKVDLKSFLPTATVMVITVTATTTNGRPLSDEEMLKVDETCQMALDLDAAKRTILEYVESRMGFIAPNLSALVGSTVAAKMMGMAGGVTALTKIPACNIVVLGNLKKTNTGFASGGQMKHAGVIFSSPLVLQTPTDYKRKAARKLAAKCALAARVDASREAMDGSLGSKFRADVEKQLEMMQAPPPGKAVKALPIPDEGPKKRRGGKRARQAKEKRAMTELRKAQNRMAFNTPEEEVGYGGDSTKGLGLIGGSTGKVRAATADPRLASKVSVSVTKKLKTFHHGGTSSMTSGLSSSVAFTPVKGIELENPEAAKQRAEANARDRYFGSSSFLKVEKKRPADEMTK